MAHIHFQGRVHPIEHGETVLEALIRAGEDVTFSCRKGSCHVCMLRATQGSPGEPATRGLRPALTDTGMFLPCCARPTGDLHVERPDTSELFTEGLVVERRALSPSVVALSIDAGADVDWRPGQYVYLRRPDGVARPYSIASSRDRDFLLTVHVGRIADGKMSGWVHDEVAVGDGIELRGPLGDCVYDHGDRRRGLLLLATGTGMAPLWGVLGEALATGHEGPIEVFHGARSTEELYMDEALRQLAARHDRLSYVGCSGADAVDNSRRLLARAFAEPRRGDWSAYVCGHPDFVSLARAAAVGAGVDRRRIRADPFEPSEIDWAEHRDPTVAPDPVLWAALDGGSKLTEILQTFYDAAYEDSRLAPYFHKVTKRRAIEQQYAFLTDLFSGSQSYFGLKPLNAHHWMVIDDDLFDYREELMESVMRRHGLSEDVIRRWAAMHERFRAEIVKTRPRGMVVDGRELPLPPPQTIVTDVPTICDGCEAEIEAGSTAMYSEQTGELFCAKCTTVASASRGGVRPR